MLETFKKVSGLAICSFLSALSVLRVIIDPDNLNILLAISPTLAIILGILAIISIGFKYATTKKFDRYMKIGIVLSILGILTGAFLGLFLC